MKSTYLSLIALVALCAGSQIQAMTQENMMQLKKMAAAKYREALKVAGDKFSAVDQATKKFTKVNEKIFQAWAAAEAFTAENDALKGNPDFNPVTSKANEHLTKAKEEARKAYTEAYGTPDFK